MSLELHAVPPCEIVEGENGQGYILFNAIRVQRQGDEIELQLMFDKRVVMRLDSATIQNGDHITLVNVAGSVPISVG